MYKINTKQLGIPPGYIYKILLIMRLTTVLLIATIMQVSAGSFAQKISLNEKNAPLEKIFDKIRLQSGYDFLFNRELLKTAKPVDINIKNVDIEDALAICFKGQPFTYTLEEKTIVIKAKMPSFLDRVVDRWAAIDVHGRVVDQEGKPLPGATVKVKGTGKSVSTNGNGEFYLEKVEEGAVLVISFIGYVSKEVSADKEMGNVVLDLSDSKLDEVQVIAYGTTTRRLSTGNVSTVTAEEIEKQPVNNPLLALQGRVPGVIVTQTSGLPGAPVTVQIRGKNSLRQKSTPLYIVDGIPYAETLPPLAGGLGTLGDGVSPFSFINPNDIESINVLKDGDATAIYGSRGANGVILITTKKGRAGAPKVNVNFQQGFSEVGKELKLMNTEQYLSMRKEALKNDGLIERLNDPAYSGVYPDLMLWDQTRYTDWQKVLIGGTAKYTDMQSSISGGSEYVQYLIGGNYHRETTVFPGDNADKKGGAHFSLTGKSLDNRFNVTLNTMYMADKSTIPSMDLTSRTIFTEPNAPAMYNDDGTINWGLYPQTGLAKTWVYDPFPISWLTPYEFNTNNLTSSIDLSYRFGDLTFKVNGGYNEIRGNSFKATPSTIYLPATVLAIGDLLRRTEYNNSLVKNLSLEPQLTYQRNTLIGTLEILVGAALQNSTTEKTFLTLSGFPSDALLRNLESASRVDGKFNTSAQYKYNAVFARISYNYLNKYLINLNMRRDGSSRFGPGNQFGDFGSVGAAWVFSEENFIKKRLPVLSFGKLRFSYGTAGNDGIGDYQYLETHRNVSLYPYQGVIGYGTAGLYEPDYHWETTQKMEFGLETGIFKDRILLSASYFRNRSGNQLINYPYPSMAGFGNLVTNLPAMIQNTGIELSLNTVNVKNKDWSWSSGFNFTRNRNKLIDYPDLSNSAYAQSVIGEPFYGFVDLYRSAGINPATGLFQFYDKNGNIVSNPETNEFPRYGADIRLTTAPKFYGGLSNAVTFKGWDLNVFIQFTKQIARDAVYQNGYYPGRRSNQLAEIYGEQWKNNGDVAEQPKFSTTIISFVYNNLRNSDKAYSDASFVRLKNVSLSYSFPRKWIDRLNVKSLKFYAQGQNLFTVTRYKGFDPETLSLDDLPPLRTITGGIQLGL